MKYFHILFIGLVFILGACNNPATPPSTSQDNTAVTSNPSLEPLKVLGNTKIESFSKAKEILLKLYKNAGRQKTFYCGCSYQGKKVDHASCGYQPKNLSNERAYRIEWEHVLPASVFGRTLDAWKTGHPRCFHNGKSYKGRECATKVDRAYRLAQADPYNLVPAIGEVNQLRSNYKMSVIAGEVRNYGDCDIEIKDRQVEPGEQLRGNIARIYLYMNHAYPQYKIIPENELPFFEDWSTSDPVDEWECERTKRIEAIQGNENPFVKKPCLEKFWW